MNNFRNIQINHNIFLINSLRRLRCHEPEGEGEDEIECSFNPDHNSHF